MHAVVIESLEEWLSGSLQPSARHEIEAHLSACEACREEIRSMREVSQLFFCLRTEEAPEPAPGFYAYVMRHVEGQRQAPGFTSLFSLDFAFGRRLVFGCLFTLAVLGTCLVSREVSQPAGISPETVMAQQNSPAFDSASAPDNMLVSLTAYEH